MIKSFKEHIYNNVICITSSKRKLNLEMTMNLILQLNNNNNVHVFNIKENNFKIEQI